MEWTRMRWEDYISKYTSFYVLFLNYLNIVIHFSVAKLHLFQTPWTAAHQASLSFTTSQSLLKLMSIELVMLSNHLILCLTLLLLPLIFPILNT